MLFFLSELQLQLNVMDKKLMQKNEEMNILLNYKVSERGEMILSFHSHDNTQVKRCELFLCMTFKLLNILSLAYYLKHYYC